MATGPIVSRLGTAVGTPRANPWWSSASPPPRTTIPCRRFGRYIRQTKTLDIRGIRGGSPAEHVSERVRSSYHLKDVGRVVDQLRASCPMLRSVPGTGLIDKYTRRDIARLAGLAGLGTWLLPEAALAGVGQGGRTPATVAVIPSWPTELRRLAPDVYAYTQASGPDVDNASLSNAGMISGPAGLLAVDTLGPPIHAKAFKAAAETATRKTFGRVINTHHHRDHTNGNCFFGSAEIVSSDYTRQATIDDGIPAHPYDNRPEWQADMNELTLAPPTTTLRGG